MVLVLKTTRIMPLPDHQKSVASCAFVYTQYW